MTLLLVSPQESNNTVFAGIFSRSNWRLCSAPGWKEALALLKKEPIPVVVCLEELEDGNWRRLLDETRFLPNPPRIIVSSQRADNRLWAEVLAAGGYDYRPMPWDPRDLLKLTSLAWQSWVRGYRPESDSRSIPGTVISAQAASASSTVKRH